MRCTFYPFGDLGGLHQPGLTLFLVAVLKCNQKRDAADAVLGPGLGEGLGIKFGETGLALHGFRGPREFGPHHLAGPAPGGPEIDDKGQGVTPGSVFEEVESDLDRMIGQQFYTAFAAFRAVAKPGFGNSVALTAGQAR